MARRKTLVQQIAEQSAKHVLSDSTRAAIDKMAAEFAKAVFSNGFGVATQLRRG